MYSSVYIADNNTSWNPEETGNKDDREDDVVSEELEKPVDINVFNNIPKALNHVMHGSLALSLQLSIKL